MEDVLIFIIACFICRWAYLEGWKREVTDRVHRLVTLAKFRRHEGNISEFTKLVLD